MWERTIPVIKPQASSREQDSYLVPIGRVALINRLIGWCDNSINGITTY